MWDHLKEKSIKLPKITWKEIDKELEPVLREMEKNGIMVDMAFLRNMSEGVEEKLKKVEKEIYSLAESEFNINSPIQMAEVLYRKLKLSTDGIKKTKNGFSTAANELKKIEGEHKIIKPILEYRELSKLLTTYLRPLPLLIDEKNRLHTHYGQDTTTGRLTSSDPNLQNIPIRGEIGSEIRKAFVAPSGMKLISADYSQIELRVVACLAQDKVMKEAFLENQDIHASTAAEIFQKDIKEITPNERRIAKTVNFGVLYGISPYGLSQSLGIDQSKAAEFIKKYFEVHSGIKDYCNLMIKKAHEEEYVETLFGYRRSFPNINSHIYNIVDAEERMAVNSPVQGTAAEILKLAMIALHKEIGELNKKGISAKMLLTIHDELVVEAKESEVEKVAKIVKETMEGVVKLCVPIVAEVKVGSNWSEMKPFDCDK